MYKLQKITMNYSLLKGFSKSVVQLVAFGLPLAVTAFETMPQTSSYLDLTIGVALSMLINYFKVKNQIAENRESL